MRSELGCRSRQKLPVLALFLPVHQDVKIGRALLAVGDGLTFAHPVKSHDRGGADDADRGVLVFQRQPLRFSVGGVGYKGRLVLNVAVRVAVAEFGRAERGECLGVGGGLSCAECLDTLRDGVFIRGGKSRDRAEQAPARSGRDDRYSWLLPPLL